jgi:hypothetical protein
VDFLSYRKCDVADLMLVHFRNTLGGDVEDVLACKIRDQVRILAKRIVAEAGRMVEVNVERQNGPPIGDDDTVEGVDVREELVTTKKRYNDEDYNWMLVRLRAFLLSYSLFNEFLNPSIVVEKEPDQNDETQPEKTSHWLLYAFVDHLFFPDANELET